MRYAALSVAMLGLGCVLAGCGQADQQDLADYVRQVSARPAPPISKMPQIAPYTPYRYAAAGRRSPFTAPTPARPSNADTVRPDVDRPLEALEQFPLDALSLVGTLTVSGRRYALIRAPDGVVHRLGVGAHLGRNYGEIKRIDAAGVALTEIVPDGNGGYTRRDAVLAFPSDRKP